MPIQSTDIHTQGHWRVDLQSYLVRTTRTVPNNNSIFNLEEAANHEWDPDIKLGLFKDVEGVKVNVK